MTSLSSDADAAKAIEKAAASAPVFYRKLIPTFDGMSREQLIAGFAAMAKMADIIRNDRQRAVTLLHEVVPVAADFYRATVTAHKVMISHVVLTKAGKFRTIREACEEYARTTTPPHWDVPDLSTFPIDSDVIAGK